MAHEIYNSKKALSFMYCAGCYLVAMAGLVWMIGFEENVWFVKTIDKGEASPLIEAVFINIWLLALFGTSHSIMARKGYKNWVVKNIPPYLERSTFILVTGGILFLICWAWRPIPVVIYDCTYLPVKWALLTINFIGTGIVMYSFILHDAKDISGWQQITSHWENGTSSNGSLKTPGLFQLVRHPLYLGFFIMFWSSTSLTLGHLLFSSGMTIYIYIGIHFEEKDLVKAYGQEYTTYANSTPRLLPRWTRKTT